MDVTINIISYLLGVIISISIIIIKERRSKMEKQTSNINIKVSSGMKKDIEKLASDNGLKVGPYIKMLIQSQLNKDQNT